MAASGQLFHTCSALAVLAREDAAAAEGLEAEAEAAHAREELGEGEARRRRCDRRRRRGGSVAVVAAACRRVHAVVSRRPPTAR